MKTVILVSFSVLPCLFLLWLAAIEALRGIAGRVAAGMDE